jgi:bifunctional pyridoxal-dependent enzyme with beta-cystathionase and maltose regulon repressor activities
VNPLPRRAELISHEDDLARLGNAAMSLLQEVGEMLASKESHLETSLTKILEQLSAAEARSTLLDQRAVEAERQADEAETWLRRLHTKLQEGLGFGEGGSNLVRPQFTKPRMESEPPLGNGSLTLSALSRAR